jgi:hypothetical protein
LIGYAYAPSLRHAPRSDQWAYLAETLDQDDFLGLVTHTYSYSRTRKSFAGDTQLFRPLLFVFVAAEKAAYGTHFTLWQGTGVVLHGLVCLLLLSILCRLRAWAAPAGRSPVDWLPYALTLFFALNPTIIDQVIWTTVGGYLLFVVLLLMAVRLLLAILEGPGLPPRRDALFLGVAWLLVLLAAFTYELGQFCAVLLGLVLAVDAILRKRRRRAALLFGLFLAVAMIYQAANAFDRWHQQGNYEDDLSPVEVVDRLFTERTPYHCARPGIIPDVVRPAPLPGNPRAAAADCGPYLERCRLPCRHHRAGSNEHPALENLSD